MLLITIKQAILKNGPALQEDVHAHRTCNTDHALLRERALREANPCSTGKHPPAENTSSFPSLASKLLEGSPWI